MSERDPLQKQVIVGKYKLNNGGWYTKEVKERYEMGAWKAIRNGQDAFKDKTSFKVSSENKMKFWKDKWYRDMPLRDSFPNLFSIASSKDAWVVDI